MKKNIFILLLIALLFSPNAAIHASSPKQGGNKQADTAKISRQQLKAQIQYFREALDNLGAASPDQAAKIWAEGPNTRNGVLQYSVACPSLKAKIIEKLGKPEKSFWNIGTSSPWVEKYEIGEMKKINPLKYQTTITYYWATSTGIENTTNEMLTIIKTGDIWCVSEVK